MVFEHGNPLQKQNFCHLNSASLRYSRPYFLHPRMPENPLCPLNPFAERSLIP